MMTKKWISVVAAGMAVSMLAAPAMAEEAQAWSVATETDKVSYDEYIAENGELNLEDIPEGVSIGVVLGEPNNEFWTTLGEGMEQGAEKFGVEIDVQYASDASDISGQLGIAEAMVNQDYDIYILSPLADDTLVTAADKIHEQGKLVVNSVSQVLSNADVFVGADQYEMGAVAAQYCIDNLEEGDKVAIVMGAIGTEVNTRRVAGFKETCEATGLVVATELPAEWDVEEALNMTRDALTTDPDIKAFFCVNDNMALGVTEAVIGEGLSPQGDVLVIGVDGVSASYDSMRDGGQTCSIDQNGLAAGEHCVEFALRLLMGQEVNRCVITPVTAIDYNNMEEYGK